MGLYYIFLYIIIVYYGFWIWVVVVGCKWLLIVLYGYLLNVNEKKIISFILYDCLFLFFLFFLKVLICWCWCYVVWIEYKFSYIDLFYFLKEIFCVWLIG